MDNTKNLAGYPPTIVVGRTGPAKYHRAIAIRNERAATVIVDGFVNLPAMFMLNDTSTRRAFWELANSGTHLIVTATGNATSVRQQFEIDGLTLPADVLFVDSAKS